MRYAASFLGTVFLGTGLVVIMAATAHPANGQEPADTPAQRTERALDERTELEFLETQLQEVLKHLENKHKVKIEFSPETNLGAKRVDPKVSVTICLKSISLRSGLHLLLDRHGLEVTVQPDGRLVAVPSTKELKAKRVESKIQMEAREILKRKLGTLINLDVTNTPLRDVLLFAAELGECQIEFDNALAESGHSPDDLVSSYLIGFPLGRALHCALTPFDLQVEIQDEVLMIVARDKSTKAKPAPEVAKALAAKLDIDLAQPLPTIAAHFTENTGVPFILHHPALKQAAIDTDRAHVLKAQGVTPAEALQRIEPKLPLILVERDGVVLVTPEAKK